MLTKGDQKVVGGKFANKVQAATAGVMPDRVKASVQGKMREPGSGKPD